MAWVATAIVGSAVVGAGAQIYGAQKGADAQKDAAAQAAQLQRDQYNQTRQDFDPYRAIGADAAGRLTNRLDELTSPIVMDQAALEKTPGYQFNLTQGLKAAQNSAAARGLGASGAALKGATTFATGLADSTYQNQFNNAQTNQANAYNRLKGLIDTGGNAAAQVGSLGEKAAYNQGTAITSGGNAEAAADNKIGNSVASAANQLGGYAQYRGLYGTGAPAVNNPYGGVANPTYYG